MVIENLVANFICMVLVYVNCNTSMYVYSIGLSAMKLHSSACNGVIVQTSNSVVILSSNVMSLQSKLYLGLMKCSLEDFQNNKLMTL